jgi:hypothetical protein
VAVFVWIVLVSIAGREASPLGRAMFWLGAALGGSVFMTIAASTLVFYLIPSFVFTNETVLPSLLLGLLIWLCPAAWLMVVALRLWTRTRI